eukprot:7785077-Pyramimonas_sp.AAC.1
MALGPRGGGREKPRQRPGAQWHGGRRGARIQEHGPAAVLLSRPREGTIQTVLAPRPERAIRRPLAPARGPLDGSAPSRGPLALGAGLRGRAAAASRTNPEREPGSRRRSDWPLQDRHKGA